MLDIPQQKDHSTVGRPPDKFSDDEVIELGKELVEWVKSKAGRESPFFIDWYGEKMTQTDWDELRQRKEFLPYYELARKYIASNIMKNKDLAQSYGNRYLGMYDTELDDHEEHKRDRQMEREIKKEARKIKIQQEAERRAQEDLAKSFLNNSWKSDTVQDDDATE